MIRVRGYSVLEMAVENGVAAGLRRFNKHRDANLAPETAEIRDVVAQAVLDSISEWFVLSDGGVADAHDE